MLQMYSQSLGYIRETGTAKGRGVFASRDITEGEVVEVCPVIVIGGPHEELPSELQVVVYNWGFLAATEISQAIALGYGGMYNHANPANMCYRAAPEIGSMIFTAVRDIAADEELTINYCSKGGEAVSEDECWFQAHQVEPVQE
jgi:SET domain-containing protein